MLLFFEQVLNGLQLGVMLFLMAAGLTLVFGIMNLINLAHGSMYMVGAYVGASVTAASGSFVLGLLAAVPAAGAVGMVVEIVVMRRLYSREHLDQVLATFGLLLFFNELVVILWGPPAAVHERAAATVSARSRSCPARPTRPIGLAIIGVGLAVAAALWLLIARTRLGMLIRAGASNRGDGAAPGRRHQAPVHAGVRAGRRARRAGRDHGCRPSWRSKSGMGESILMVTFVVIVIGGIGSVRGALVGALMVGLVDTLGRAFLPLSLRAVMPPAQADSAGAALASMAIYLLMAAVLVWRPRGLFPAAR